MKHLLSLVLILFSFQLLAQKVRVNENFVISIDNDIALSITNVRFIIMDSSNKKSTIAADYIPGELAVYKTEEKIKLCTDTMAAGVTLAFDDITVKKKETVVHTYEIPLNVKWFNYSFAVLRINNLHKNKYQEDEYYYSWSFPGYSILPTRKKIKQMSKTK